MLKNHPDRLPKNLPETKRKEMVDRVKEINDAWDRYNNQLKNKTAIE